MRFAVQQSMVAQLKVVDDSSSSLVNAVSSNKYPQKKAVTPENVGTVDVGMSFTNESYAPHMARHATSVTNKTT